MKKVAITVVVVVNSTCLGIRLCRLAFN